jgi:hypothetical protein
VVNPEGSTTFLSYSDQVEKGAGVLEPLLAHENSFSGAILQAAGLFRLQEGNYLYKHILGRY